MRGYPNAGPRHPQPKWMRDLRPGDAVQEGNSRPRIVRKVSFNPQGQLRYVTLAIRRCSWTHRAYTVLYIGDIWTRGFRKLPMRRQRMATRADQRLQRAIQQPAGEPKCMTCCDVEAAGLD